MKKVVAFRDAQPKYGLNTIRKTFRFVKDMKEINRWRKYAEKEGNRYIKNKL